MSTCVSAWAHMACIWRSEDNQKSWGGVSPLCPPSAIKSGSSALRIGALTTEWFPGSSFCF